MTSSTFYRERSQKGRLHKDDKRTRGLGGWVCLTACSTAKDTTGRGTDTIILYLRSNYVLNVCLPHQTISTMKAGTFICLIHCLSP